MNGEINRDIADIDILSGDITETQPEITGNINTLDILSGNIVEIESEDLTGDIVSIDILSGDITESQTIEGHIEEVVIKVIRPEDEYTGEYVVTPRVGEQILYTNDKHMSSDVTVETIPISKTNNLSGGLTVYIG